MWPGEEKDFRLVTVDGDTTVRSADQDKRVVFILRDKKRERERGWVKESTTTICSQRQRKETKERESNPPRVSGMSYLYSDL